MCAILYAELNDTLKKIISTLQDEILTKQLSERFGAVLTDQRHNTISLTVMVG